MPIGRVVALVEAEVPERSHKKKKRVVSYNNLSHEHAQTTAMELIWDGYTNVIISRVDDQVKHLNGWKYPFTLWASRPRREKRYDRAH